MVRATDALSSPVLVHYPHFDGLVLDCSNSSALAMELLQSCTKPSMCLCTQLVEGGIPHPYDILLLEINVLLKSSSDWCHSITLPCCRLICIVCTANERRRYNVMSSPIGWVHTQNDPWILVSISSEDFVATDIAVTSTSPMNKIGNMYGFWYFGMFCLFPNSSG